MKSLRSLTTLSCLALGLWAHAARAEGPPSASIQPPESAVTEAPQSPTADDPEKSAMAPVIKTRRGGFTAGIYGAMSFGTVSGYPNDLAKIDDPAYRSATSGVGSAGMLYIGGTLTDWFTFGFGFSRTSFGSSKIMTSGGAFLFHLEAFPMFSLGGTLRDVGVFADFGTGSATIVRRDDKMEFSSSGSLSIGGVGAFWEPWRASNHWVAGPFAAVQYQDSDSMSRTFGEIGLRGTFYGGGP
jgi:hypothetical protein